MELLLNIKKFFILILILILGVGNISYRKINGIQLVSFRIRNIFNPIKLQGYKKLQYLI